MAWDIFKHPAPEHIKKKFPPGVFDDKRWSGIIEALTKEIEQARREANDPENTVWSANESWKRHVRKIYKALLSGNQRPFVEQVVHTMLKQRDIKPIGTKTEETQLKLITCINPRIIKSEDVKTTVKKTKEQLDALEKQVEKAKIEEANKAVEKKTNDIAAEATKSVASL